MMMGNELDLSMIMVCVYISETIDGIICNIYCTSNSYNVIPTCIHIIGIKYIFGTGFDETHREIEEKDLHHEHYGPDSVHDVPDRAHGKTREQVLHEKRIGELDLSKGPKPFGWFGKFHIMILSAFIIVLFLHAQLMECLLIIQRNIN